MTKRTRKTKHTSPSAKKGRAKPAIRVRTLKRWGIGLVVLLLMGTSLAFYAQLAAQERDLSVIGNGQPTVVQVLDSGCHLCRQLQRNAKSALRPYTDDVQWRVANISTTDGRLFANRYGVSHVTLVLFDAQGRRVQTINGVQDTDVLAPVFERLASVR